MKPVDTQHDLTPRDKKPSIQEEGTYQGPYFEPAVDIYETETALKLEADMPGVGVEDMTVDLRDSQLTLTGKIRPADERWKPRYEEYRLGHFIRRFRLGQDIDQAGIEAQMKDGVLMLTLPKARAAQPRRIQIKMSE